MQYSKPDPAVLQYSVLGPPPTHFSALRRANSQVMAELFARRITYGQFAGQLNQNEIAFMQQDQILRTQAQRDAAQATQAFEQQLIQQQQINLQQQQLLNQRRPAPPNPVNCTTQYVGNMAYTNCH